MTNKLWANSQRNWRNSKWPINEWWKILWNIWNPEGYDDVISKNLDFQDIDFNLDWRFKNLFYIILYFLGLEKLEGLLNIFNNDFKQKMFSHDIIRDTKYIDEYDINVPALINVIRTFFTLCMIFIFRRMKILK